MGSFDDLIPSTGDDFQATGSFSDLVPRKPEVRGTMPFLNKAIAETVGAPVDIVASGLNLIPGLDISDPIGGSASISRFFQRMGTPMPSKEAAPKTAGEQIGRSIGEITALTIPSTLGIKAITAGTRLASKVAAPIWQSMLKHPGLYAASEISAGVGTGTARYAGEEMGVESPLGKAALEVVGGVAGGIAPTAAIHTPLAITTRVGKSALKRATLPFTEAGAKYRAGEFLKKQVSDPSKAISKLGEETIGELPPTVRAAEKRLNALLGQIRNSDPIVDAEVIERATKSAQILAKDLQKMGYGTTEQMRLITQKRLDSISLSMDKRILSATKKAQDRLSALSTAKRRSAESRIVRDELEKALHTERVKERALWGEVPKDTKVSYGDSKQMYRKIFDETPTAQREDIPNVAKNSFLAKKGDATETTVNEMWGLRSKLLENSRKAKAAGDYNSARIADELADSILDDLGAKAGPDITESGRQLNSALTHSRQLNERFKKGIVGKILGYDRTGAPSIAPDITLDISVGRAGAKGAVDIDKIIVSPESAAAAERYITRSFTDYATDKTTNVLNPKRAKAWIANNEELLDKFPKLRGQIADASEAQKMADSTRIAMEARRARLQNPKISKASRILNMEVGEEIDKAFKGARPEVDIRSMMRFARKDKSGDAVNGVRGAIIDHIFKKSASGSYNELGEQMLSGRRLTALLNDKKYSKVLGESFSTRQISRMKKIASELSKLELAEDKMPGIKIELDDIASSALRLFSRVGGAQIGRWVAKVTGGGTVQTPGIFSERFKNFAQHLNRDRAFQLIHDAVTSENDDLLKALLLPIKKPTTPSGLKNIRVLGNRINMWLLGSGKRVLEDIEKEEQSKEMIGLQSQQGIPTY